MIKDSYPESHRKHMAYEIARQNNQWRLNVRRKGLPRQIWENNSEYVGLFLYSFAGIIAIALLMLLVLL